MIRRPDHLRSFLAATGGDAGPWCVRYDAQEGLTREVVRSPTKSTESPVARVLCEAPADDHEVSAMAARVEARLFGRRSP